MASLSQALHLGSLLLPHNAFQEHAAQPTEWSQRLTPRAQSVLAYAQVLRHSSMTLSRRTRIKWQPTGLQMPRAPHPLMSCYDRTCGRRFGA